MGSVDSFTTNMKVFATVLCTLAVACAAPDHGIRPFGRAIAPVVARPVVAHAVARPVVAHAVARPVVAHAPVVARPVAHAPSPYSYEHGVHDDYSGANFNAGESGDGNGYVEGSYSVLLPDGRTQHVNYHSDDYSGYIADVSYDGTAAYAAPVAHAAPVIAHAAPVVHRAPVVAHAAPVVAHAAPVYRG